MTTITLVTPVYNDWESLFILLDQLAAAAAQTDIVFDVLAVNDGSDQALEPFVRLPESRSSLRRVEVVHLLTNLGHQRAIAVGLAEAQRRGGSDAILIMDADGEDRPEDALRLIEAHRAQPNHIIAAQRTKRSERWGFRFFYMIYKLVFHMLVGQVIDFGNFCLIPAAQLKRLVYRAAIWNNLPAAIIRSRLPLLRLQTWRGTRYAGQSRMNLVSLMIHGLSAISVYSDAIFVRTLLISSVIGLLALGGIASVVMIRLFTDLAIPGWATGATGTLVLILFQAVLFSAGATLLALNGRSADYHMPAREALHFIDSIQVIRGQDE